MSILFTWIRSVFCLVIVMQMLFFSFCFDFLTYDDINVTWSNSFLNNHYSPHIYHYRSKKEELVMATKCKTQFYVFITFQDLIAILLSTKWNLNLDLRNYGIIKFTSCNYVKIRVHLSTSSINSSTHFSSLYLHSYTCNIKISTICNQCMENIHSSWPRSALIILW